MIHNRQYTFETSFWYTTSSEEKVQLKGKKITVVEETSNYYVCYVMGENLPVLLSKCQLDETFKIETEYTELKDTGMFYEVFPEFTGTWSEDKEEFTKFYNQREANNENKECNI